MVRVVVFLSRKSQCICNVTFDHLDYSVFKENCKGDHHTSRKQCCAAWKLFMCPIRQYVNLETDCINYIFYEIYNRNPTMEDEYFKNYCREPDKKELDCRPIDDLLIHHGKEPVHVAPPIKDNLKYKR
ncbi:GPI-anchored protein LORELEI [Linum perenne]